MNSKARYFIWLLLILFYQTSKAQSAYEFGFLPAINLTQKLKNDWQVNYKIESRQLFKQGLFREEVEFDYDYLLTDFSAVTSKKIRYNHQFVAGMLMRSIRDDWTPRFIQQFILTRQYNFFRLAHRVSTDQTFVKDESMEFRLRYRVSALLPFNGQEIDPKEFYFKLNHEYLNSFQGEEYDLEVRVVPSIGYKFSDLNKLELGFDYRIDSFLEPPSRQRYWITVNWYLTI